MREREKLKERKLKRERESERGREKVYERDFPKYEEMPFAIIRKM